MLFVSALLATVYIVQVRYVVRGINIVNSSHKKVVLHGNFTYSDSLDLDLEHIIFQILVHGVGVGGAGASPVSANGGILPYFQTKLKLSERDQDPSSS